MSANFFVFGPSLQANKNKIKTLQKKIELNRFLLILKHFHGSSIFVANFDVIKEISLVNVRCLFIIGIAQRIIYKLKQHKFRTGNFLRNYKWTQNVPNCFFNLLAGSKGLYVFLGCVKAGPKSSSKLNSACCRRAAVRILCVDLASTY